GVHYLQWTDTESAKPYDDLTEEWDSIGMVPYIADANGVLTVGYENPRSIEIKCDYIKEKGFRGAMNWRTELDLDSMQLARTVARNLRNIE
ncbi:MAG: glycosyl hydrolase family 18, partial [Muribaculaceae bacterium]|nr:glycosyl hydrolase family 18 [Muribaculaceae bacterium]